MQISDVVRDAKDAITVRRVFAEPYEAGGITVIAAAKVAGASGVGGGRDKDGAGGEGSGFAVAARPAGVYVIREGDVTWRPAVDVNRVVSTVGAVTIVWLLTRARITRARLRAAGRR